MKHTVTLITLLLLSWNSIPTSQAQQPAPTTKPVKVEPVKINNIRMPGVKMSDKIPTNFPIPTYPRNVTSTAFMHSTQGSSSATATICTTDPPAGVFDWYQAACKSRGWNVMVPSSKAKAEQSVYILNATKAKHQVYLTCQKNPSGNGAMVSITWSYNMGVQMP
ncbi:MAG: hypothetical protein KC777_16805 [Cyanobacteria bacterium HKST-UBA02]|nr:hypothetical protein [Cyanobacteria bacterium HKST-UBA02]